MGRLQHDLRQRRPFSTAQEEAYLNLIRTADQLARAVSRVLKPEGITEAQYNVLRILRGAGDLGHACSEIADRLVTYDPDVTRLLDRLEARGLLSRSRDGSDRRVVTARITNAGLLLLDELDGPVRRVVDDALGHLTASRLNSLIGLLEVARDPSIAAGRRRAAANQPSRRTPGARSRGPGIRR